MGLVFRPVCSLKGNSSRLLQINVCLQVLGEYYCICAPVQVAGSELRHGTLSRTFFANHYDIIGNLTFDLLYINRDNSIHCEVRVGLTFHY